MPWNATACGASDSIAAGFSPTPGEWRVVVTERGGDVVRLLALRCSVAGIRSRSICASKYEYGSSERRCAPLDGIAGGSVERNTGRQPTVRACHGTLVRIMKCIGYFRGAYGGWPTEIEVSDEILRSLIDAFLTPLGFFLFQLRLRVRPAPDGEEQWILVRSGADASYNYTYNRFGAAPGRREKCEEGVLGGVAEWLGWDTSGAH